MNNQTKNLRGKTFDEAAESSGTWGEDDGTFGDMNEALSPGARVIDAVNCEAAEADTWRRLDLAKVARRYWWAPVIGLVVDVWPAGEASFTRRSSVRCDVAQLRFHSTDGAGWNR